jgi:hypothetical protein
MPVWDCATPGALRIGAASAGAVMVAAVSNAAAAMPKKVFDMLSPPVRIPEESTFETPSGSEFIRVPTSNAFAG